MQVAEVGVLISITTQMDLTAADTITLTTRGPMPLHTTQSLTFTAAGTTGASRVSTATDFPNAGVYEIQLSAAFSGPTRLFKSRVLELEIGGAV